MIQKTLFSVLVLIGFSSSLWASDMQQFDELNDPYFGLNRLFSPDLEAPGIEISGCLGKAISSPPSRARSLRSDSVDPNSNSNPNSNPDVQFNEAAEEFKDLETGDIELSALEVMLREEVETIFLNKEILIRRLKELDDLSARASLNLDLVEEQRCTLRISMGKAAESLMEKKKDASTHAITEVVTIIKRAEAFVAQMRSSTHLENECESESDPIIAELSVNSSKIRDTTVQIESGSESEDEG